MCMSPLEASTGLCTDLRGPTRGQAFQLQRETVSCGNHVALSGQEFQNIQRSYFTGSWMLDTQNRPDSQVVRCHFG